MRRRWKAAQVSRLSACNRATTSSMILLDYTSAFAENPRQVHRSGFTFAPGGGSRAVFAGMDRAVYQSKVRRPRPLAARRRRSQGSLQQLRFAAAQRPAAPGTSLSDASPLAGQLSPAHPAPLNCGRPTGAFRSPWNPAENEGAAAGGNGRSGVRGTEVELVLARPACRIPGSLPAGQEPGVSQGLQVASNSRI
jgi:hypothetical protein